MTDLVLKTLLNAGADASVIEEYIKKITHSTQASTTPIVSNEEHLTATQAPPKPKRKLTEKQLAALAAGRAKNPRMIAKQQRLAKEQEVTNTASPADSQ